MTQYWSNFCFIDICNRTSPRAWRVHEDKFAMSESVFERVGERGEAAMSESGFGRVGERGEAAMSESGFGESASGARPRLGEVIFAMTLID